MQKVETLTFAYPVDPSSGRRLSPRALKFRTGLPIERLKGNGLSPESPWSTS
jgi:hypothetical protein